MTKIYFYPKISLKPGDIQNSYASDFEMAVGSHHEVINKTENSKGVLDFFKYLGKADIYLFNWIEEIPRRRYGKLQVLFFMIFLVLRKFFRNKIIWVLHNKYSHNLNKNLWTDFMFNKMMKNADLIITHSNEGIEFTKRNYPKYAHKIIYEIHPIKERLKSETSQKKFDFLFWGTIHPYKNVVKFLKFLKTRKDIEAPKVLIVGHCSDDDYEKELTSCLTDNVIFENKFYEMDAIADLAAQSKYILFTYSAQSVLSSGALMDSIRMSTEIIGPNHGAFKDLAFLPTIHVYDTYEDVVRIFKNGAKIKKSNQQELDRFIEENGWLKFAERLQKHTKKLMNPS